MKVLVTGATGFLGYALTLDLVASGHDVSALSRSAEANGRLPETVHVAPWSPFDEAAPISAIEGVDAIIHLAGEPVNGTWTRRKRQAILDSRVTGTRNLLLGIAAADPRPRHLVCASAIGYYGDRGEELLDEDAAPGDGFLADVCRQWEAEAGSARELGLAVTSARFGIVLGRDGGALAPLQRATKLGAGGPLGSGRQWWSWIHFDDAVKAIAHILETGPDEPLNVVAPEPVRQRDLAHALGRALHRPAVLPTPAFMLRAVLDGFATELLSSRRVSGQTLAGSGFVHRFGDLDAALADLTRT
jgi:uncharacterized protein